MTLGRGAKPHAGAQEPGEGIGTGANGAGFAGGAAIGS